MAWLRLGSTPRHVEPGRAGRRFLRHIALAGLDCENTRPSGFIRGRTKSSTRSAIRWTSAAEIDAAAYAMSGEAAVSVNAGISSAVSPA